MYGEVCEGVTVLISSIPSSLSCLQIYVVFASWSQSFFTSIFANSEDLCAQMYILQLPYCPYSIAQPTHIYESFSKCFATNQHRRKSGAGAAARARRRRRRRQACDDAGWLQSISRETRTYCIYARRGCSERASIQ